MTPDDVREAARLIVQFADAHDAAANESERALAMSALSDLIGDDDIVVEIARALLSQRRGRDEALEEAARVCEDVKNNGPVVTSTCWHAVASQLDHAATAIRALVSAAKEKENSAAGAAPIASTAEVFDAAWTAIQHSERIEIKTVRRKLSVHELRTFLQLVLAPYVQPDLTNGPPGKPSAAFDAWFDSLPEGYEAPYQLAWWAWCAAAEAGGVVRQRPEGVSSDALVGKAREILADYDAGRPLQVSGDGWLLRFAAALSKAGG